MEKTILVVDDSLEVIMYVTDVLDEIGHKIVTAQNGEEALEKVAEIQPNLIILDVLMPKQSGIKMYRELKTNDALKHIPVVILSGISKRTFLRSQEALAEFGGQPVPEPNAYLEKPAEPEQLTQIVREILG